MGTNNHKHKNNKHWQKNSSSERGKNIQPRFYIGEKFKPARLGKFILEHYLTVYSDGQFLYRYDNGVYRPDGEEQFSLIAARLLGEDYKNHWVKEALQWVKTTRVIQDKSLINPQDDLINVANGLLNWRTGELLPHTRKRLSTIQIPVNYDPEANDECIMGFVQTVIPEDTIQTIFEIVGYCLTTNTKYEKAVMLTGSGGNGKSTFINMLSALIGKANMTNISLQDLENNRFKLAELLNKLVNTFADLPRTGLSNANIFKSIVSGDSVSAERKYHDPFDFRPFAKLLFSANEIPRSADITEGFYRRWIIIPFEKKFVPGTADTDLSRKLTTPTALSTLLNFAIEGLRRLEQNNGFTKSETVCKMLDQYRLENDNVLRFVDECCVLDADETCMTKNLFARYQDWCKESNYKSLGKGNFHKRLEARFKFEKKRVKGETCERWVGITFDDNDPFS